MLDYRNQSLEALQFTQSEALLSPAAFHSTITLPMWHQAHSSLSARSVVLKRVMDLAVALVLFLLLASPMLLIALAIRIDSPGPALFRQRRVGLNGREFEMLKFRTMHHHLRCYGDCQQASRHDPRVTSLGHFLRCLSLDELPQLINVMRGEMSIVGPRPHAPGTRAGGRRFEDVDPRYAERHRVRPGMTGLAQVRGWRGETDTEEKLLHRISCDMEYIAHWSLALDLWIIVCTVVTVLRMRNAY